MKDFDYLITPTMPTTAYNAELPWPQDSQANRYGYHFGHNPFTWLFNVTLQPAVSVPCGLAGGMPVGLQIVAPRGDDFGCVGRGDRLREGPWALRTSARPLGA